MEGFRLQLQPAVIFPSLSLWQRVQVSHLVSLCRRWRQCQEQAFLQGQGLLPPPSSPPSTLLLDSELLAHGWTGAAVCQHPAAPQALQRQMEQPTPQAALPHKFSLASLLALDDHTH